MSFNSSIEIIQVVFSDPRIQATASVADAAAVSPSIPRALFTDFNNGKPDFNNGARNLKKSPFCILVNCAFHNLISVDMWLAKFLQRFSTCLLVSNNL